MNQVSDVVRIGKKDVTDYMAASLLSLRDNNSVTLEGLGRWNGKVFAVAEKLEEKDNLAVGNPTFFVVDGTEGIRIRVEKE